MTIAYTLTAAAEADVREIVRYTRSRWGDAQVRRYTARLERRVTQLVSGKTASRDMSDLYPALRTAKCDNHFVFWLPRADAPALVVAILHERMDLMVRLASRLA